MNKYQDNLSFFRIMIFFIKHSIQPWTLVIILKINNELMLMLMLMFCI